MLTILAAIIALALAVSVDVGVTHFWPNLSNYDGFISGFVALAVFDWIKRRLLQWWGDTLI